MNLLVCQEVQVASDETEATRAMHFERNGGKSEAVRKDDTTEKKDDDTEDIYH